ncbi:hypothetical protein Tco_0697769 [Tanacetum coccineum]
MRRGATASSRLYPVVGCTREQSCCSWDSNPPRPFLHLSHTCTQAQSAAATVAAACASVRQRLAATVAAAWWCRHSPDIGGNLVTWRSKKQKVVALSSAEAEFRGNARGITEVLWIRKLLTEIGYPPQEPSKVVSDNKATIQISENSVQHGRIKHIEIDRHFIKEKLEAEVITFPFVRSQDQLADILTKAVNERTLHECLGKLNFGNPTIQLEGEC